MGQIGRRSRRAELAPSAACSCCLDQRPTPQLPQPTCSWQLFPRNPRSEKKLLNTINRRPYAEGGCRFPIMEAPLSPAAATDSEQPARPAAPRKVKARIQTPAEKIQLLVRAQPLLLRRPGRS